MEVVLDLFFHFQVEVRKNMKDNLLNKTTNGKAKTNIRLMMKNPCKSKYLHSL